MPVRIMAYVALLYQDLIRAGQVPAAGPLPPVFPLVLYNGKARWSAARDVSAMIPEAPAGLERYRPQMRYLLVAENEYRDEQLAPMRNLAAALFRLENSRTLEDFRRVLLALAEWVSAPEQEGLRRALAIWMSRVVLPRRLPGVRVPEVQELREVGAMIAEREIDWTREWRERGWQEGRQEGQAGLVLKLVECKFGPLDEVRRQRIAEADTETLIDWGVRLLTAERLDDVFAE